jgi:hypothetical protein
MNTTPTPLPSDTTTADAGSAITAVTEFLRQFEQVREGGGKVHSVAADLTSPRADLTSQHLHTLLTTIREQAAQLRPAQDDAWKRGYDACKTGEQRHSPYRAVKAEAVMDEPAPVDAPEQSPLQMSAHDARKWAYDNLPLYTYEELVNVSDEDLKLMIEAHYAHD